MPQTNAQTQRVGLNKSAALKFIAASLIMSMIMSGCVQNEDVLDDNRLTTNLVHKLFIKAGLVEKFSILFQFKMGVLPVSALEVHSIGGRNNTTWYDGVAHVEKELKLSFKVPGTVSKINYKVGKKFWHERVFATLDSSIQQEIVDKFEAVVEQLELQASKASAKYTSVNEQLKKGAATVNDANAARKKLQGAELKLRRQRNKLKAARIDMEHHEIRITLRGIIKSIDVAVGDTVEMDQTIAVMKLTMPAEVTADVPAIFIARVGIRGRAKARIKNGRTHNADVLKIGAPSNGPKGTFPVTVRLRRPNSSIKTGMEASVAFKFDYRARKKLFLLPHGSVGSDGQGNYVYIINPTGDDTGTLERRPVVTGKVTAWGHEVSEGLQNSELIVSYGIDRLKHGMQVKWK